MIERDDIHRTSSVLDREQVRALALETWKRRPAAERLPNVAKRFALELAEQHPFEADGRPRDAVILSWIRPWVVQPPRRRERGPIERWLNRPWYRRSHWPLRLAAAAFLLGVAVKSFTEFAAGRPAFGGFWLLMSGPAAVLCSMLWIDRRPGR